MKMGMNTKMPVILAVLAVLASLRQQTPGDANIDELKWRLKFAFWVLLLGDIVLIWLIMKNGR